ncbi:MAG: fumarylacetoacetate hydrolase family protein [Gemmataceae bacterium]
MQLCKFRDGTGAARVGLVDGGSVLPLDLGKHGPGATLATLLHAENPAGVVQALPRGTAVPLASVELLAPVDQQDIWAAGVTYKRSKVAREEESASSGASRFYDLVYTAARPELFFKSSAARVVPTGKAVRIRRDARWSVPEPELALILSPALKIVGYTIGNDMSSRDIEGENPLYLPQAKMYDGACALGPVITLAGHLPPLAETHIRLNIQRGGRAVFEGQTNLSMMARTFEELAGWLGREMAFPDGAVLLTGTGVVPPDDFTLTQGDEITIEVTGIGRLVNHVG